MPNDFELTKEEAAQLIGKSTRQFERYAREKKLSKRYVRKGRSREVRFSRSEVEKLRDDMTSGENSTRRHNDDVNGGTISGSIHIQDFLKEYRDVVAQLGYLRAKTEEVKLLEERAQSLQQEISEKTTALEEQSARRRDVEAKAQQLEEQLSTINKALERSSLNNNRLRVTLTVFAILVVTGGVVMFILIFKPPFF